MKQADKAAYFSLAWRVEAPAGAPAPEPEYKRAVPGRRFRLDFAWPEHKVCVEVDGGQWAKRGGRHNTDADREKINLLVLNGWRVLRYSPDMIEANPAKVVQQVLSLIWQTKGVDTHARTQPARRSHGTGADRRAVSRMA